MSTIELTWEQKFAALRAISEVSLKMRGPGNWYVSDHIEIGGDGFLSGVTQAAATPEEAVQDAWNQLVVDLPSDRHLVIGGNSRTRQCYRWNGFMWETVEQKPA